MMKQICNLLNCVDPVVPEPPKIQLRNATATHVVFNWTGFHSCWIKETISVVESV